ncbi:HNH endonuclease [Acidovorax sp. BL-A-41-H1]|uniref:HNH endonuclease n=1 Tax=Acidovorax sp. BL-A-41-H1 TaxID=3421102 RepID=UPI003F7A7250
MSIDLLSADQLRELLAYDCDTGVFTWRVTRTGAATAGSVAGCIDNKGYRCILIYRKRYKAHRLAWLHVYGAWPSMDLDHINRVKDDNRIANLREATASQNMRNRPIFKNNTSGFVGVSFNKRQGKWTAKICADGKRNHLGYFHTAEAAHEAYQARAAEITGSSV